MTNFSSGWSLWKTSFLASGSKSEVWKSRMSLTSSSGSKGKSGGMASAEGGGPGEEMVNIGYGRMTARKYISGSIQTVFRAPVVVEMSKMDQLRALEGIVGPLDGSGNPAEFKMRKQASQEPPMNGAYWNFMRLFKDISDEKNFPGVKIYQTKAIAPNSAVTLPGIDILVHENLQGTSRTSILQHEYGHYKFIP